MRLCVCVCVCIKVFTFYICNDLLKQGMEMGPKQNTWYYSLVLRGFMCVTGAPIPLSIVHLYQDCFKNQKGHSFNPQTNKYYT